jgi:hypothetical protein
MDTGSAAEEDQIKLIGDKIGFHVNYGNGGKSRAWITQAMVLQDAAL